ncbi:16S rRNA processing protein RimM [Chloracidobacterium sp. MS 40/45]|jgi:16S rRNA processing protein RimM|uniref:ribosome maturation factor RimM n=1 Tax=Chloracidobacterium aggregatum TaxID=2851959 RepID=UPI001B8BC717|nr:ribosome maturation factor RimM [Chloracidobacterium aggregatum]QUV99596.1 16S rRNA processing protein RimM [Chloracidobacterium sp. MS 40/45]
MSGLADPRQSEELITIAAIRRPRGLRGEVVATSLSDYPERFAPGIPVWLRPPRGAGRSAVIERAWFHKGNVILKFVGLDHINAVEPLAGHQVCVPLSARVVPPPDEFFQDDLIGCRVELENGEVVGTVVDVVPYGGGTLVVERLHPDGHRQECLVPFVRAICTSVDVAAKWIRISPPEGLLD